MAISSNPATFTVGLSHCLRIRTHLSSYVENLVF
jgi:hypothetical protein